MTKLFLTLMAIVTLMMSASFADAQQCKKQQMSQISTHAAADDIVDTAVAAGQFNTLAAALKAGGLIDTLKGNGPFTVFAPTDAAFAKLPKSAIAELLKPENKDALVEILTYHVVPGQVKAADVVKLKKAGTVAGSNVKVGASDKCVMLNDAKVLKTDIDCSNGVIHVIDSVLMPPKDIVETAVAAGDVKTLVAAVKAAGLVETLQGDGLFTVFALNDAAFKKLPQSAIAELLKPENKGKLAAILTYHVVPGKVMAADVVGLDSAKTAQGSEVSIKTADGGVMIDGAKVIAADIECGNGVIHVIDSVIMPKN